MKLGKVGAGLAMATSAGKMIAGIMAIIHWVLGWFVASVVPFLRTNMGERYFSWINLMFGMTAVGLFTGLGNVILSQGQTHLSWTIELAYYGVLGLGVYHRFVIYRKNKRGVLWHSYCPGISLIRLPGVSVETVAKWIEPAVLFALAYIAGQFHDRPLCLWLNIGGFALLVHEQVAYYLQRQQLLDARDAMIESKNLGAVMAGRPMAQTAGYTIATSNLAIIEQSPEVKDSFSGLPNELRGIMDEVKA